MKVHILGSGDAYGSGGRNASAYLLNLDGSLVLIDCGPTTLVAMKRAGYDPARLDAVLLSHLHGDHYGGLPFFLIEYLHVTPRATPLRIAGPAGTEARVRGLLDIMYPAASGPRELPPTIFQILEPGKKEAIDSVELLRFRVPHQVQDVSLGLKITHRGKTLLYSGDSAWTEDFVTHADGADLFLMECCFFEGNPADHMSYRKLEENLPRLKCKKLLLTHMGEEMLARRSELSVAAAEDGMSLDF